MNEIEAIHKLLSDTYYCQIKQISPKKQNITVLRKNKIGIEKKILGLFPICEYEKWDEELSNWENKSLVLVNNLTGRKQDVDILICYDKVDDILYWKFNM